MNWQDFQRKWHAFWRSNITYVALVALVVINIVRYVPDDNLRMISLGAIAFVMFIRNIGFLMWLIGYAERKEEDDPTQTTESIRLYGRQKVITYIQTADPLMLLFVFAPITVTGLMLPSPFVQLYRNDPYWWMYFASWLVFLLVGYACWYMFRNWTRFSDPNWLGVRKFIWTSYFKGCRVFEIPSGKNEAGDQAGKKEKNGQPIMDLIFIPATKYDANSSHDKTSPEALISLMQQRPLTPPVPGAPPQATQSGRQFALLNLQFGLDVFNQPALITELYLDYFREDKERGNHRFTAIKPARKVDDKDIAAGPLNKQVLQIGLQRADAVLAPEFVNDARSQFARMNTSLTSTLETDLAVTGVKLYQATLGGLDDVDDKGFFHQQERLGQALRDQEIKQEVAVAQAEARIEAAKQNERAVKEEMRVRGLIADEQVKAIDKEVVVAKSTAERDIQSFVRKMKEMTEDGRRQIIFARLVDMSPEQITEFYKTTAQAMGLNVPEGGNVTLVNAAADARGLPPTSLVDSFLRLFQGTPALPSTP